jgi:hypothetical protein
MIETSQLQLVGTAFAGVSLVFTALGLLRHAHVARRQHNAQIFLDCVKRYEQVMAAYPPGAWEQRLAPGEHGLPASTPALRHALLRHLHLFGEERYLRRRGYFSEDIWAVWEGLFRRLLRGALLRREWPALRAEFDNDPEFVAWCERDLLAPAIPS